MYRETLYKLFNKYACSKESNNMVVEKTLKVTINFHKK